MMSRKNNEKKEKPTVPTVIEDGLPTDATAKAPLSQVSPQKESDNVKHFKGPEDVDPGGIKREKKFVCIMGHPRSGTGYMAHLFQAFGYDVAHEVKMGTDGISSWLFGGCDNPRWGPDPWNYDFINRIHVVRNPIKVLSSVLACVEQGVQEIMAREAGVDIEIPAPRRVCEVYLRWHERILCRKPNMTIKVEDAPEALTAWLHREPDPNKLPPTDFNNRKQKLGGMDVPDFPWSFWQEEVKWHTLINLVELARNYGYHITNGEE
jgi:hypothetical protein